MQRIESIPVKNPGQSAWAEEHGLRQICYVGSLSDPPLDPLRAEEFFLPCKQYGIGVQSLTLGHVELPGFKVSDGFKDLLRLSVDGNFAVLDETTFMLNRRCRLPFIR